jgi:hypothetical protein
LPVVWASARAKDSSYPALDSIPVTNQARKHPAAAGCSFAQKTPRMPHLLSSLPGCRSATFGVSSQPKGFSDAGAELAKLDSALKNRILCRFMKRSPAFV